MSSARVGIVAVALAALVVAIVVATDGGGPDSGPSAEDSCPPGAPFERPPPRGLEYWAVTDAMIDELRTSGSLDLDRDDVAMRQVIRSGRLVGVAAAARQFLPEEEAASFGDAIAAAASRELGVRVVPREIELGSGRATLIEFGPRSYTLAALAGCRLLVIRGEDERTLRRLGAHLLAAG